MEKWKTKSIRKVQKRHNDNKILYFYFLYMQGYIFHEKMVCENVVYTITFLVKFLLDLQDI